MSNPHADDLPALDGVPTAMIGPAGAPRVVKPRPGAQSTVPAVLSTTPNVARLLLALRRRWLLALSLGLLCAPIVGGVMWVMRPITFTAKTTLHVKSVPDRLVYDIPDGKGDFSNYQRVQIALVKSRLVLLSALREPKVGKLSIVLKQDEPVAWLEKEIQADFSTAPEILRIAMTGDNTQELPILVDAVRKAYLSEIVHKETKARQTRLDQLKKYFAEYDASLRDKRDTLKRMVRSVGSQDKKLLATRQEFNAKHLQELQSELLKRQSELRTAKLEVSVYEVGEKANVAATVPDVVIEGELKKDPAALRFLKEINQHELDIATFKERSPHAEKEPGYVNLVQALDLSKKALANRREQLRPDIVAQVREKLRDDQQQLRIKIGDRVRFLTEMEKQLDAEIELRSKDVNAFKNEVVDLEWLQDEIAQLDVVNKEVTRQMQTLQIEIQAPPRVTELEEAIVVPAMTESNRLRTAGGAGLGTFAAVLFGIAFLEFRSRRVNNADDVVQGLNMKLVGSLPLVPRRALQGRGTGTQNIQWQNRLTESVDGIRTTLLSAARFEGLRKVMVTSAVGGEGKTLLSCHLAVSLARAGCKTLLIDGDLRRPAVHSLFNMPLGQGLSELLRGEVEPAGVTNAGPLEGLSVITAGQSDSQAIQNLARKRIGDVLEQLSENYEFVVIDSAPVLPVADSQLIGQHVDGVVVSVMNDVSRLPNVYAACERLGLLRIRILGAVVNGMRGNAYHSLYYNNSSALATKPSATETPSATEK